MWTRTPVAEYRACFPSTALPAGCLLPFPGSSGGECPRFNSTMKRYDFPVPRPDDLWIRRSAPAPALVFARSGTRALPAAWLLGLRSGAVRPVRSAGNTGTSQSLPPRRRGFLGCPSCAYALLSDPGRTSTPHQLGASVLPPYPIRRRLPRRTISGLDHTASAPAVYASQPALLPDHARLACGGW